MTKQYSRMDFFRLGLAEAVDAFSGAVDGIKEAFAPPAEETAVFGRPFRGAKEYLRPPGALPEEQFLKACTSCNDCVMACPHWVIRKAGPEMGPGLAGTPIIIPKENPCLMCEDVPCIPACQEGALVLPEDGQFPSLGIARVDESRCYQALGQPCDYCQVNCPTRPRAITVSTPGTPPVVQDHCTGCGQCAQICPPSAITIESGRP